MSDKSNLIGMTAEIVSAYVSHNTVRSDEVSALIATVHAALGEIGAPKIVEEPTPELKPAVPIKKSVTDEYIVSLEDGRKFKTMKRYLSLLGMTPDDYRAKWGLPRDYPMVAPGYAAKRSGLAKASGLGSARRLAAAAAAAAAEPTSEPAAANDAIEAPAKRRGRPKKAA